jgi:hypothetical protein
MPAYQTPYREDVTQSENINSGMPFCVGDRVIVTGGYDNDPEWLKGGPGYQGEVTNIDGNWMTVKLDSELILEATRSEGWPFFGSGSQKRTGSIPVAQGSWLALCHGWVGREWVEPIGRTHVALCETYPDIGTIPPGGGIGAWVESHGTVKHVLNAALQ